MSRISVSSYITLWINLFFFYWAECFKNGKTVPNFFLLFVIMQNVEKQKIYVFLENKIGIGFRLFNKNFQNFFTLTVPEKILKNRSRFLQRKMYFFSYSIALCSTRWYLISETLHISWYQKKCDRNIWVTNHYIQGFPYKYYGIFHCFFVDIITNALCNAHFEVSMLKI